MLNQHYLRGRFKNYLNKVGEGPQKGYPALYIIPSIYTGEILGLLTFLTKVKNYGKDRYMLRSMSVLETIPLTTEKIHSKVSLSKLIFQDQERIKHGY